jgi:hypothetical protein
MGRSRARGFYTAFAARSRPGPLAAYPPITATPWISISMRKEAFAQLHESVAETRVVDEHRHGDHVGEPAAEALERLVEKAENRRDLGVEIAGNVVAGLVLGRGLPGEPDRAPALRDDRGRISA